MTPQVAEKLKSMEARYQELMRLVSDPSVQADQTAFRTHSKALVDLQQVVEGYGQWKELDAERTGHRELVAGDDPEMAALAKEEIPALEAKLDALEQRLRLLLVPRDPNDDRNVVLEIRAGTGGDEAALFAGDLYRMYSRYAERQGWKIDVLSMSENGIGGLKEVVATVEGRGVYGLLKHESGVHRVQRVPTTEASGRIHTSTATVAVLPEAEEVDVHIEAKDLRIDTFCSSGPGGQSVNTTYSAVRITHLPTGVVVSQQDEKSQIKNRSKAMKVLRARLYEMELRKRDDARAADRKGQVGSGDRSERIRTYNFPQSRITDHRINLTLYKLDEVMEGRALDEIIDALTADDEAGRLAELAA